MTNFLGIDNEKDANYVILPIAYEGTVSYGKGTSLGPEAILKASTQLELYDIETQNEINKLPRFTRGLSQGNQHRGAAQRISAAFNIVWGRRHPVDPDYP